MAESAKAEDHKIAPLRPADCGLIEHAVRRFNASVPGDLSETDLENPDLWVNIASKFEMGSEVRCLAEDMSFVANGVVTFVQGSTAKVKIVEFYKLDKVDHSEFNNVVGDYGIEMRGRKKWCIVQKSTGDIIKDGIADQLTAMRELTDYQKALSM